MSRKRIVSRLGLTINRLVSRWDLHISTPFPSQLNSSTTANISSQDPQYGLTWVQKSFSLESRWNFEPSIEAIKQTVQSIRPSATIEVAFLTQGAFNKIYDVRIDNEMLVMRISLPVDPYYKTASEVATLDWVHRTTNIPVPLIVAHQSSRDSPVGFEWILMAKLPGSPLSEKNMDVSPTLHQITSG